MGRRSCQVRSMSAVPPIATGVSAAVHVAVRAGIKRIHLIAPTTADFHDVNLEGKSGILATCGRDPRPRWVSSKRRLEWPNAAVCVFFSGEEPESLRGPQCELCVIDEIARIALSTASLRRRGSQHRRVFFLAQDARGCPWV